MRQLTFWPGIGARSMSTASGWEFPIMRELSSGSDPCQEAATCFACGK